MGILVNRYGKTEDMAQNAKPPPHITKGAFYPNMIRIKGRFKVSRGTKRPKENPIYAPGYDLNNNQSHKTCILVKVCNHTK